MPVVTLETRDLPVVDWHRHSVGFAPAVHDEQAQLQRAAINFTRDEMKIIRTLLTREVPGSGGLIPYLECPNIKTFVEALAAMEQWAVERGMP